MSGIMCAVVSATQNIVYAQGWFTNSTVDLSPITNSVRTSSNNQTVEVDQTWVGYIRPTVSGTNFVAIQTTREAADRVNSSANTTGRLWLGSLAISGFNNDNTTVLASNNQTTTTPVTLVAGQYYPVRMRWTGRYERGGSTPFGTTNNSSGSITFQLNETDEVSGQVWYNTLTNGF